MHAAGICKTMALAALALPCIGASAQGTEVYRFCYAHNLEKPGAVYSQIVHMKALPDGTSPQGLVFYKNFESQLEGMGITTPVFCDGGATVAEAETKKAKKKVDGDWYGGDIVASTAGMDAPPPPPEPPAPKVTPTLTIVPSETPQEKRARLEMEARRDLQDKLFKARQEQEIAKAKAEYAQREAETAAKQAERDRQRAKCKICQ
jgi:hypothetical protein